MSRISRGWLAVFVSVAGLAVCLRMIWQCWLYCIGEAPNLYLSFIGMLATSFDLDISPASNGEGVYSVISMPFVWVGGLIFWLIPTISTAIIISFTIRTIQIGFSRAVKESLPAARSFIRAFYSGSDRE